MPYANPEDRRAARRRYEQARPNRRSSTRNTSRTARRAEHELTFVGVDGEGVDRPDGTHDYNLLSIGDQSLHHLDGSRLTTDDVFGFLWSCAEPGSTYVGFYIGYDLAQWLRDLPDERAAMLLTEAGQAKRRRTNSHGNPIPYPVRWGRWEFDVLPNLKRFKLRLQGEKGWVYVCDAGPLYQMSLLAAIDPEDWPEGLAVVTPAEFEQVTRGKAERGASVVPRGTPVDPDTIAYNVLENELLSRLMTRTNEGLVGMGVRLTKTQWHGPGQAAQAWLKNTAPDHTGDACRDATGDLGPFEAAQASYFGGWFEIMAHGHVPGETFEYDINSAYPAIIATLPCLLHGTWSHTTGRVRRRADYRLVRADVSGSDPYVGAMPHRRGINVLRPSWTSGWFWEHELTAARRAGLIDRARIYESWTYEPCDCPPPFAPVADLYEHRLRVGKKTPHGRAMRLVYNSAYGKMAQSVGAPMFGNSVYASLITAGCRTKILEAIGTHPEGTAAVVMVATDGVYFTSPHPGLDVDPARLGAWDAATKENLTLFKPGVYWDDKARSAIEGGGRLKLRSRGISAKALSEQVANIDRLFQRFYGHPDSIMWPAITITVPFGVVSPRQALNRGKWHLCGAVEHDKHLIQTSAPHAKRDPRPPEACVDLALLRSSPHANAGHEPSVPYERSFGYDGIRAKALDGDLPIVPEGELNGLLAAWFGVG